MSESRVDQQETEDFVSNLDKTKSDIEYDIGTAIKGAIDSIPGATAFTNYVNSKTRGTTVQKEALETEKRLQGTGATSGYVAGLVGQAAAIPVLSAANVVAQAAKNAGAAAVLSAAQLLGEEAKIDQMEITPSTVDQYWNAIAEHPLQILASGVLGGVVGGIAPSGAKKLAEKALTSVEESAADKILQRTKSVRKAVRQSGVAKGEEDLLLERAEKEGILDNYAKADELRAQTGKKTEELLKQAEWDHIDHSGIVDDLEVIGATEKTSDGPAVRTFLRGLQDHISVNQPDSETLATEASRLLADARKSIATAPTAINEAKVAAAQAIKGRLAQALGLKDPKLALQYQELNNDYKIYVNLKNILESAPKQTKFASPGDVAKLAVKTLVGGPLKAGAAAAGLVTKTPTSNYTLARALLRRLPSEAFTEQMDSAVQGLFAAGGFTGPKEAGKLFGEYDRIKNTLQKIESDPEGYGKRFHEELTDAGMPPQLADALTVKQMQIVGDLFHLQPKSNAPPSLFQDTEDHITPFQRQKFERQAEAYLSPLDSIKSGDVTRIEAAKSAHPETFKILQQRIVEKLQRGEKVPFKMQRLVGTVLGGPGVPGQDPLLGAQMQNLIQARKNIDAQGQQNSARVVKAVGNRDASIAKTQADRIINPNQK